MEEARETARAWIAEECRNALGALDHESIVSTLVALQRAVSHAEWILDLESTE